MTLKKLQQQFQSCLLKNNSDINFYIKDAGSLSAQSRLQIYKNSYFERIISALSQDYPVLKAAISDHAFSSLVTDYIKTYPSADFNLRSAGKFLPDFILSKNPEFLMYADLAKLEWLLCEIEMDCSKKQLKTTYNIFSLWKNFQENKTIIDFILLPYETVIQIYKKQPDESPYLVENPHEVFF